MKPALTLAVMGAVLGVDETVRILSRNLPYNVGVSAAKPHDPERVRRAEEKRQRRAARRAQSSPNNPVSHGSAAKNSKT